MCTLHGALQEELAAALLRSYAGRLAMEAGLSSDRLASAGPQESTNTAYILRTLQARPCRSLAKPYRNIEDCRGPCAATSWVPLPHNALSCAGSATQEGAHPNKSVRMAHGFHGLLPNHLLPMSTNRVLL